MNLLLDWLAREGHILFAWWLWISLAGAAALPLCLRLLAGLPDRGYTLARPLGLLLVTFVFWLLGSWGFLDNSNGSILLSWLLVLLAALAIFARRISGHELRCWWRENRPLVLASEILFFALFFVWALYRAHQNDLHGTEKPMELAFLSAAQRSLTLPPADPWMSGYAISYYYMGYVMSSSLSLLSGISSTIGFNLTNASLLALTGSTTFGVAYNLVRSRAFDRLRGKARGSASRAAAILTGLLAMLMLTLMGNFQLLLIELPYNSRAATPEYFDLWGTDRRSNFSDGAYLQNAGARLSLDTSDWEWWWWFRASRVLADYDLNGNLTGTQPIDEFPAFSFLLSDNHPHVLALPFVVAVIGLMLNLVLLRREPTGHEILLYGIAVGGLAFLNAWDGAIYLCGLIGAEALRRLMASERGRLLARDWLALARFGICLVATAAIAYMPYFIGFRSQAGGLLPNLAHPTFFPRFFIMFGPFIVILAVYLTVESWRAISSRRFNLRLGLSSGLTLALVLLVLMSLFGAAIAIMYPGQPISGSLSADADAGELVRRLAQRRAEYGVTALVLLVGITAVVARLFPDHRREWAEGEVAITWITYPRATGFALLLIGMGLCLTLFPEFFYLKDNFGVRINTVFKFYYQAWVLWSLGSAYAVYSILRDIQLPLPALVLRLALGAVFSVCLATGLLYTVAGVSHRALIETGRHITAGSRRYEAPPEWETPIRHVADGASVEHGAILYSRLNLSDAAEADIIRAGQSGVAAVHEGQIVIHEPLTLDGAAGLLNQDDQSVIGCLSAAVGRADAVVAEAVYGAYDIRYGRVGVLAGIPVMLGWENHERQWRGPTYSAIAGTRRDDIERLYRAPDIDSANLIIERYHVTHILFGETERQLYGSQGEEKFLDHLPVVCESGESRVFYAGNATD